MSFIKILLTITYLQTLPVQGQALEHFQWKKRVLLLIDTSDERQELTSQLAAFLCQKPELTDRDLIVLTVTDTVRTYGIVGGNHPSAKSILEDLGVSKDFTGLLLVGKDGGIKYKNKFKVNPTVIFDKIDGMPMRRAEMKESQ